MSKTVKTTTVATKPSQTATSTKDAGKVQVGGSCMRYNSVTDKGKVHVGGSCMRF